MLICPLMSKSDKEGLAVHLACLEENCALWLPKGEVKEERMTAMQMKVYEHAGCCSIKALARRI